MTQIKIGSRVVTRKFETNDDINYLSYMQQFVDKEGVVEDISYEGNHKVHGFWWPKESVELVSKEWEPVPGEMVEVRQWDKDKWVRAKFIGMDENRFICKGNGYDDWKYCQPITKSLEEKIIDYFNGRGFCFEYAKIQDDIIDIIKNHKEEK